jgi:hypothetical protein
VTAGLTGGAGTRVAALEWLRTHVPEVVVAAAAGISTVVIYVEGRGLSFFYDEWQMALERRGNDLDAFFGSHGGHMIAVPVAVYRVLFALVGMRHYGPFRLTVVALHLMCAVLFFLLIRRRIDRRVAALATVVVLFLGTAWQDLLWPFQIGFLGSIAAGLGALLALEREDRRGDVAAACLLTVSWACSGLGIPFLIGAAVDVAWTRSRVRRSWVVAVPVALYALWYAAYGESQGSLSNVRYVPRYVFDSLAGTLGAITGLGTDWGRPLAALAALFVVARLFGRGPISRRTAVAAAVVLSFWTITSLVRGPIGEPDASRYLYPNAVLVLIVAVELTTRVVFTRRDLCVLTVLVLGAVVANLGVLRDGAAGLRDNSAKVAAELGIVELESGIVAPDFRPDLTRAPQIYAGLYLAAVRELGSPAFPAAELPTASPEVKALADSVLVQVIAPELVTRGPAGQTARPPRLLGHEGGTLRRQHGCAVLRPDAGSPASIDAAIPRSGVVVRTDAPAELFLRRFADGYPEAPSLQLEPGTSLIRPPADASPQPWSARLAASSVIEVCRGR